MERVAVLRGGPSEEYGVSMETGLGVLSALNALGYHHKDIVITKNGDWLDGGFVKPPESALEGIDVVFVALHGTYGEDGQVQRVLERRMIPFTGTRSLSSAIAFNKELTKRTLLPNNILMPKYRRVSRADNVNLDDLVPVLNAELGEELFLKPVASGSSLGARYIPSKAVLRMALEEALERYDSVLVEEYIRGREATVGVLSGFRNETTYVLPTIEVIPPYGEPLFSYEHKYSGKAVEEIPGRFSYPEKAKLAETASLVHDVIGCKHYSRSDFIVRNGEIYFLEINTLPGLTSQSLYPKAAAAVGLSYNDLVKHLVETAVQ